MDNIIIADESGDRRYFTIIPNYVLNHSTATAQALYLQLKRIAGENGIAYAGNKYLINKLGITRHTLAKELKYLLGKKWIEFVGYTIVNTDGGKQKIKTYKIVDLWQLNNEYYKGGQNRTPLAHKGGATRGGKITDKEEPIKKNYIMNKGFEKIEETVNQRLKRLTTNLKR